MTTKRDTRPPEAVAVKLVMVQRGMKTRDLARLAGVNYFHLRNELSRGISSERVRMLIEGALDTPFWSTQEDFERRQALGRKLGKNPFSLSYLDLQRLAVEWRVAGWTRAGTKTALVKALADHSAEASARGGCAPGAACPGQETAGAKGEGSFAGTGARRTDG